MDAALLGDISRNFIVGATLAYIVAWMAYGAELAIRARLRSESRESIAVGAGASSAADAVGTGPAADAGIASTTGEGELERVDRLGRIGLSVTILATLLLAAGVLTRTLAIERAPWGNMYEFSITGALVASVVFVATARTRAGRAAAVWLVLLLLITVGLAVSVLYVPPGPLVPALQSYWLVLHVGLAVVAFGLFTVAAVVNGLQIAAERRERQGRVSALPAAATLDRLAYRLIAVAFPVWTVGPLILGAVWAEVSWGRYWGWDPKEVWALITWLVYAAYLHARATAGWKGTRASVVALVGYGTVLFSYFAVNIIFNGLHSYGGV
jgi:cytochrome c-type biogenesis protein CcsB